MGKDYYQILSVAKGATPDEIKKAFRKKAHQFHPDKQGGDEAKFKEVNEAYQVLSDEKKRAQYDQFGKTFEGAGQQYAHMNWDDFMGNFGDIFRGFSSGGFSTGHQAQGGFDIGDIFSGFGVGRSSTGQSEVRGRDLEFGLELDLKEAVFGTDKEIKLESFVECERCQGKGAEPESKIIQCPECQGTGAVQTSHRTILGNIVQRTVCPTCRGRGEKPEKYCKKCHGAGRSNAKRVIKVKIPAGIDDGQSLRLNTQGEAGEHGAQAGDLYVTVQVRPDKKFHREGNDLFTTQELSFVQAALGDTVHLETLDGDVKLKIPAGTQPGQLVRLKGKGVPYLQGPGRGDLLVEAKVQVPTKLSRKQKQLLEELEL